MLGISTCLVTILVGAEYCGVATILPMVMTQRVIISSLYLGFVLLHTTKNHEMTKKKQKQKCLHLKTLLFSDLYRIQIVQKTTQLSSKGRFNQPPLFLIH
jgi:uncharacterized membrane protein